MNIIYILASHTALLGGGGYKATFYASLRFSSQVCLHQEKNLCLSRISKERLKKTTVHRKNYTEGDSFAMGGAQNITTAMQQYVWTDVSWFFSRCGTHPHTGEIKSHSLCCYYPRILKNLKNNFGHAFINQVLGADTRRQEVRILNSLWCDLGGPGVENNPVEKGEKD